MLSACYSCHVLMKLEFCLQNLKKKKYSYAKFHENPPSGSSVVPCEGTDRRTDRQNKANSRFVSFVNAPKSQCCRDVTPGRLVSCSLYLE